MKEKNRYIKRSRWWLTVPAVYVLMILIILRLYVITGENWHIIGISVQPFDTAFQLEVTSSNPQLDIASLTDGLKLKQEKMQKEGMTGWIIQGTDSKRISGNQAGDSCELCGRPGEGKLENKKLAENRNAVDCQI